MSDPASSQPQTLTELLEWRQSLPGWVRRSTSDYLDELRRVCQWGRSEARGIQLDELLRPARNEPQLVPATAFFDYRLDRQLDNHGQLSDHLSFPKWQSLQFSSQTCAMWRAALEAGELNAPRSAAAALPALPTPVAPAATPASDAPTQTQRGGGKGGRRPGSGAIDDSQWLARMLELLATGTATSVNAASKMVAHDAIGASENTKRLRLGRKFSYKYGVQPPPGKTWQDVQHEFNTN